MSIKYRLAFLSLAMAALVSCAEEKEPTLREQQEKILDAYITVNCPSAQKLQSGLTIISLNPGSDKKPGTNDGIYIHYNTYDLSGTCQSSTDSVKARMLGTYSPSIYYGPSLFILNNTSTQGMRELLSKLGKGGSVTAIIPPWLTTSGTTSGSYTDSKGQQSSVSMIYEIKAGIVIDDVEKYQIDSLESYSKKYFSPKIDSTAYGYYFRNYNHPSGIPAADTITAGTSVGVWYVGRLLDGYVFDTNIADTAKKYRIYDSSNEYTPLSVTIEDTFNKMSNYDTGSATNDPSISSGGKSTMIIGFARALKSMTYLDKATVFMMSGLGYGSEGNMESGVGVPEYAMLCFDIWVAHSSDTKFPPTKKP